MDLRVVLRIRILTIFLRSDGGHGCILKTVMACNTS